MQRLHEPHERQNLLLTTLDMGLRPVKVRWATPDWVILEKSVLHLPPGEAVKSQESWAPVLREDMIDVLRRGLEQRLPVDRYVGTDALWLNNGGIRTGHARARNCCSPCLSYPISLMNSVT